LAIDGLIRLGSAKRFCCQRPGYGRSVLPVGAGRKRPRGGSMAPEQEDRTRQLEALRRYVSNLYDRRERAQAEAAQPSPVPEPDPQRPSRRWLLLASLLVVLALVGGVVVGAVAWSDDRPAGAEGVSSPTQRPTVTSGLPSANTTPVASPACKTAVDRANTMLAIAVKLQRTLAEYSRILNDRSNRGLSGREVRKKSAPVLRAGASESARFDQALADYRKVVDQCELQTP
jgi:hypothetical protein